MEGPPVRPSEAPARATAEPANEPTGAPAASGGLGRELAEAVDPEAVAELWERYGDGEQDVFSRRLYTAEGQATFDAVRSRYAREPAFRAQVDRFVADFERLIADVSKNDNGTTVAQSYLTSDTGKTYTLLAHAAGRFDE